MSSNDPKTVEEFLNECPHLFEIQEFFNGRIKLRVEKSSEESTRAIDRYFIALKLDADPLWSRPFDGGIAIAQYILDNPEAFRGKQVIDTGTGCGIAAVAAAIVGAKVTAVDICKRATLAAQVNARLNNVSVEAKRADVFNREIYKNAEIIIAGDVFYKKLRGFDTLLIEQAIKGKTVYAASVDVNLGELMALNKETKLQEINPCKQPNVSLIKLNIDACSMANAQKPSQSWRKILLTGKTL